MNKTLIKKFYFNVHLNEALLLENDETMTTAAKVIADGGLVAFPTETVYGLGCNAFDGVAVKKVYEAKGRPSDNPLIIHICNYAMLDNLIGYLPEKAKKLMDLFWPGPITFILPKGDAVALDVTGGLSSVAVRFPNNEVALRLIEKANVPIAAPSANSSGKPSPTRATHVAFDLDGKIDMIIDGGACEFGLESTIVDVTEEIPVLLRPGSITLEMLQQAVGEVKVDDGVIYKIEGEHKPKAPGMKYTHYAPKATVNIVNGELEAVVSTINNFVLENAPHQKIGIMATEQTKHLYTCENVLSVGDRNDPKTIGANLFKILRKFDHIGVELVYAEGFSDSEVYMAVMNRLRKAAGFHIINV